MLPVTHGITPNKNPITIDFRLETTTNNLLQPIDFDIYAPIGARIIVDYGDGILVNETIDVSPKLITGLSAGLNQIIIGEFVERISFRNTSAIRTINILFGLSITSLQALSTNNSTIESVNISNVPNATTMHSICLNTSNLNTFNIDDSSNIIIMQNAFAITSLTATPNLNYSSALNLQAMYQNSTLLSSASIINSVNGENFLAMFAGCIILECLEGINTLSQTNTTSMFLNTPLLTNPNAAEQTAILAGSNYVNANPCP